MMPLRQIGLAVLCLTTAALGQGVQLANPPSTYFQDSASSPTREFDYNSGTTWDLSVPTGDQMTWDSLDGVYYNNSTTEKWTFTLPLEDDNPPPGAKYRYVHRRVGGSLIDEGWVF